MTDEPAEPTAPERLRKIEHALVGLVTAPSPIEPNTPEAERASAFAAGNERVRPHEQVDIYRRQFWMRHEEALREDYPGLAAALGDAGFSSLVRDYLAAHPPRHPSLRELGFALGDFLSTYEGLPQTRAEFLRELARYEGLFIPVFDAPDAPPLTAEQLSALPPQAWERGAALLQPWIFVIELAFPVHQFRREVRRDVLEPEAEKTSSGPFETPFSTPRSVVLYRQDGTVRYREVPRRAGVLLETLLRGASLVAACEAAASAHVHDEPPETLSHHVTDWFRTWASLGWFRAQPTPTPPFSPPC